MARATLLSVALLSAMSLGSVARAEVLLVSSTPADKTIIAPTARIALHFSEPVDASSSGGSLVETAMMMGGRMMSMTMTLGPLAAAPDPGDPNGLILTTRKPLSSGAYRLDWRATGADARASHGAVTFTVQ
jgi:methionine-rich copper-binding protein CopC